MECLHILFINLITFISANQEIHLVKNTYTELDLERYIIGTIVAQLKARAQLECSSR